MKGFTDVEVYRALNSVEAHLLRSHLQQAGIEARVGGEILQAAVGALPFGWTTLPRVYVSAEDEQQARVTIEQWQYLLEDGSPDDDAEYWQCACCRAEVEESFDLCWNCGAGKDGVAREGRPEEFEYLDSPWSHRHEPGARNGLPDSSVAIPKTVEDFTSAWQFNPRAAILGILIMTVLSLVCWSVGASILTFITLAIVANVFSAFVGWTVNLAMHFRESS